MPMNNQSNKLECISKHAPRLPTKNYACTCIRNYSIYYTMNLHLSTRMNRGQIGLSDDTFFVNLKCMAYIHVQDLQRIASSRNEQERPGWTTLQVCLEVLRGSNYTYQIYRNGYSSCQLI